jgi:DNA-binding NarL/FixJ family response regulator
MSEQTVESPIRVVIADDHAVVREGLRTFLGMHPDIEIVGEVTNGVEAIAEVSRLHPDVVLMDLVMPQVDGVEATRRIMAEHPDVKVIVVTSFADDDKIYPAIRAGAVSYLLKDAHPTAIVEAVRAAIRGESRLAPEVTQRLVNAQADGGDPTGDLTARELEVLACLGKGLSNRDIGEKLFISQKTVKTHVSNILDKLDCTDRTQAALFAARHGLADGS